MQTRHPVGHVYHKNSYIRYVTINYKYLTYLTYKYLMYNTRIKL